MSNLSRPEVTRSVAAGSSFQDENRGSNTPLSRAEAALIRIWQSENANKPSHNLPSPASYELPFDQRDFQIGKPMRRDRSDQSGARIVAFPSDIGVIGMPMTRDASDQACARIVAFGDSEVIGMPMTRDASDQSRAHIVTFDKFDAMLGGRMSRDMSDQQHVHLPPINFWSLEEMDHTRRGLQTVEYSNHHPKGDLDLPLGQEASYIAERIPVPQEILGQKFPLDFFEGTTQFHKLEFLLFDENHRFYACPSGVRYFSDRHNRTVRSLSELDPS